MCHSILVSLKASNKPWPRQAFLKLDQFEKDNSIILREQEYDLQLVCSTILSRVDTIVFLDLFQIIFQIHTQPNNIYETKFTLEISCLFYANLIFTFRQWPILDKRLTPLP